jgi:protease II
MRKAHISSLLMVIAYSVSMSNSFQYIYLEFKTKSSPTSNEIWVKNISSRSDFELIKPITYAIEYEAHHQASSFYILETDNITKVKKVQC